uniref:WLGC domain-containing protein n=1 Tax=Globisporangium ultimum (strain ATCC 200006 / CBS 805.95 / DAOM BR144) TaxID=431595 RepID=K3X7U7_GLOUD
MARKKQMPLIRPSAYPGARLDSTTWRAMFGISTKKMNAVVPHTGSNNKRPAEIISGKARCGPEIVPESHEETSKQIHHLTFLQNFGLMGVSLLLVIATSIHWTAWLTILNAIPNAAANYLTNTTALDNGSFWLIVGPDTQQLILAGCGFGLVQLGYLYVLLKMTWWMNEDLPDSTTNYMLKKLTLCLTRSHGTRQQRLLAFWNDLTGFHGQRRKFWDLCLKALDLGIQIIALQTMLELGFPAQLCYTYSMLISLNSLSCAVLILKPARSAARREIVFDAILDLDRERFLLYLEESSGHVSLERQARLMANPSQYSGFLTIFEQLRMKTALNFVITVGLNVSFCYRLKRVIETRIRERRKLLYNNQDIFAPRVQPPAPRSVSKYMVLPFLTLTVFIVSYAYRSVDSSASMCAPYPECVVFAHRMDNDDLCPCLVLVDVDRAPGTYEEWIHPVNVTSRVQALAASGDLRALQLINRRLHEWPNELEWCINMQHISLIYTGTETIPTWFKSFTKLHLLNIEGQPNDTSLLSMPDDVFRNMAQLTFLHMGSLPLLAALPSLDGLVNLQSLSLVALSSIQALPSFQSLKRLDHLDLVALPHIGEIPDLVVLSKQLSHLVLQDMQACCNGNIGACDLTQPFCSSGVSCTTNATTAETNQRLTELLHQTNGSSWAYYTTLINEVSTTKATIDVCGGMMYRKCGVDAGYSRNDSTTADQIAMCYNQRMHVIACRPAEMDIQIRKLEIQKGLGVSCDPIEEAWLGCASG